MNFKAINQAFKILAPDLKIPLVHKAEGEQ
jgi:hypothetical protein